MTIANPSPAEVQLPSSLPAQIFQTASILSSQGTTRTTTVQCTQLWCVDSGTLEKVDTTAGGLGGARWTEVEDLNKNKHSEIAK